MATPLSSLRPLGPLKQALRQCRAERRQRRTYATTEALYPSLQTRYPPPSPGFRPSQAIKQNQKQVSKKDSAASQSSPHPVLPSKPAATPSPPSPPPNSPSSTPPAPVPASSPPATPTAPNQATSYTCASATGTPSPASASQYDSDINRSILQSYYGTS
ncbi:hypothetical protein LTR09_001825 [Extremus antarcticus]|uniref:Uncharacterized protein n=1 Tax=Extremus antarcticus TaxID=702011 RepID=A0AAJ0GHI2_9PEZI|nr:hypothetical protein LTR09_001825 [Extremus antarcticus]